MDELDGIFNAVGTNGSRQGERPRRIAPGGRAPSARKPGASSFVRSGLNSAPAAYTEDGYRIYAEDELKMGQGGHTHECPFDCSCCF